MLVKVHARYWRISNVEKVFWLNTDTIQIAALDPENHFVQIQGERVELTVESAKALENMLKTLGYAANTEWQLNNFSLNCTGLSEESL